ncbi:hypothetical protein AMAG_03566 [Allomyces macrogynus ATCC 38327]|uniref:Uncharacterized protein n=1 Tax=Allomyces macrogynus (strain ATCC 38327) TaxID=578462 RepID=A0A0L0SA41_ALLM3|nr:hypothetical protein AMAG_03566 [Allomyces macrogynus ATCC 38327]|eukprot:KNE59255.1 hypothetical protein AMAG_03566 [Allomyces macrogynus ATCC 38327]
MATSSLAPAPPSRIGGPLWPASPGAARMQPYPTQFDEAVANNPDNLQGVVQMQRDVFVLDDMVRKYQAKLDYETAARAAVLQRIAHLPPSKRAARKEAEQQASFMTQRIEVLARELVTFSARLAQMKDALHVAQVRQLHDRLDALAATAAERARGPMPARNVSLAHRADVAPRPLPLVAVLSPPPAVPPPMAPPPPLPMAPASSVAPAPATSVVAVATAPASSVPWIPPSINRDLADLEDQIRALAVAPNDIPSPPMTAALSPRPLPPLPHLTPSPLPAPPAAGKSPPAPEAFTSPVLAPPASDGTGAPAVAHRVGATDDARWGDGGRRGKRHQSSLFGVGIAASRASGRSRAAPPPPPPEAPKTQADLYGSLFAFLRDDPAQCRRLIDPLDPPIPRGSDDDDEWDDEAASAEYIETTWVIDTHLADLMYDLVAAARGAASAAAQQPRVAGIDEVARDHDWSTLSASLLAMVAILSAERARLHVPSPSPPLATASPAQFLPMAHRFLASVAEDLAAAQVTDPRSLGPVALPTEVREHTAKLEQAVKKLLRERDDWDRVRAEADTAHAAELRSLADEVAAAQVAERQARDDARALRTQLEEARVLVSVMQANVAQAQRMTAEKDRALDATRAELTATKNALANAQLATASATSAFVPPFATSAGGGRRPSAASSASDGASTVTAAMRTPRTRMAGPLPMAATTTPTASSPPAVASSPLASAMAATARVLAPPSPTSGALEQARQDGRRGRGEAREEAARAKAKLTQVEHLFFGPVDAAAAVAAGGAAGDAGDNDQAAAERVQEEDHASPLDGPERNIVSPALGDAAESDDGESSDEDENDPAAQNAARWDQLLATVPDRDPDPNDDAAGPERLEVESVPTPRPTPSPVPVVRSPAPGAPPAPGGVARDGAGPAHIDGPMLAA